MSKVPSKDPVEIPRRTMPLWQKIIIGFALVVGAFFGYVAMLPAAFQVERSTTINAPPAAVFAEVNDFHRWDAWSPWVKVDPNAKATFEGAEAGNGAVFKWAGNAEVGEGSMTILDSRAPSHIHIRLDFLEPMEGSSQVEFAFEPVGEQTKVTWRMFGESNFVSRCFCVFMNMDKMIGGKYEEGLAKMKEIVEQKKSAPVEEKPTPAENKPVEESKSPS